MMQGTVEKIIKSQLGSTHCFICDSKLQSGSIATQHYSSKRHMNNVTVYRKRALEILQQKTSTEVVEKVATSTKVTQKKMPQQRHCEICDVRFDLKAANQHFQGDEHKRQEETYCNICGTPANSKEQLWQHLHSAKHNAKLKELGQPAVDVQSGPFDETIPVSLRRSMLRDICHICKKRFPTIKHALDHYKNKKHSVLVERLLEEMEDGTPECFDITTNGHLNKNANHVGPNHGTFSEKLVDYICYVCNMKVCEDNHRSSFPHVQLVHLKCEMASQGILEEYWIRHKKTILCTICTVSMRSPLEAEEHFMKSSHFANFISWCKSLDSTKVASDSSIKYFYCRVCDQRLDCTSEAEHHYLTKSHQENHHLYCYVCNVRNETPEMLLIHYTTTLHKSNFQKSINQGGQQKPNKISVSKNEKKIEKTERIGGQEIDKNSLQKNLENKELNLYSILENSRFNSDKRDSGLKEQVFHEIEKLVKTLYYSKTVPYNVALEYLKRINAEVEELKNKYDKKGSQEFSAEEGAGVDAGYLESKNNEEINLSTLCGKEVSAEDEFYTFNSSTMPSKETLPPIDLIDFSDDLPTTTIEKVVKNGSNVIDSCDHNLAKTDLDNSSINEVSCVEKEKKIVHNHELRPKVDQKDQLEDQGNLETMLKEIVLLKSQVDERYPNEDKIEKDVLTEIERLINLVNSNAIPPDVILMYLQDFTKDLDSQEFNPLIEEENDIKSKAFKECTRKKAKDDIVYRYSKEDLMSLRSERTFTELPSIQLRMSINQARIWNKQWNDLDLD